ncbi:type II toxin-antitoxin system Phd/YefM family antitoxin [Vreelandella utahensis]|uniref:type II toxin-antitoxin system Phd/YefM family antitoxin n=1 Tax=Vreelandella halophila TaxID=86177 RepID=UPI0009852D8B|nr:type II toxin-antitoxin system prevent-host-death family antitoxin [Halomonas utahensis]
MEATTKYLRLHTRELMAAVERGEEVIITWRGQRRARLTGYDPSPEPASAPNPAFGMWSDSVEDVDQQVRRLRQPRTFE